MNKLFFKVLMLAVMLSVLPSPVFAEKETDLYTVKVRAVGGKCKNLMRPSKTYSSDSEKYSLTVKGTKAWKNLKRESQCIFSFSVKPKAGVEVPVPSPVIELYEVQYGGSAYGDIKTKKIFTKRTSKRGRLRRRVSVIKYIQYYQAEVIQKNDPDRSVLGLAYIEVYQ